MEFNRLKNKILLMAIYTIDFQLVSFQQFSIRFRYQIPNTDMISYHWQNRYQLVCRADFC